MRRREAGQVSPAKTVTPPKSSMPPPPPFQPPNGVEVPVAQEIPGQLEQVGRILDPARDSALLAAAVLYRSRAATASLDALQESLVPAVLRTAEQFEAWLGRERGDGR